MYRSSNIVKAQHRVNKHKKINLLRERLHSHVLHFCNVATPHGLVHLVRPKRTRFEKCFWLVCIILVSIPCVIISRQALNRYMYAPTVSTILRDYQYWKSTFPAFTLCPVEILEPSDEFFEPVWKFFKERGYHISYLDGPNSTEVSREEDDDDAYNFTQTLILGNINTYGNTLAAFKKKFGRIDPRDYIILSNLSAAIFEEDPLERFSIDRTITEYGVCYTTNSILANYSTAEYVISYMLKEFLYDQKFLNKDMSLVSKYNISDILASEEDPLLRLGKIRLPVKVFFHSYNEIVVSGNKFTLLEANKMLHVITTSEKYTTTGDVLKFSVTQRHCRQTHESNLPHSPVYSYNLCRQECKIQKILQLCNCLPFYYRPLEGEKVCDIDGMICTSKHKDEIIDESRCECVAQCENEIIIILSSTYFDWFFSSEIQVTYNMITQTRIRLETIYSETDFLVQIGGLAGLAYGVGLLSIVEIIYFLTLRLYFVLRGRTVHACDTSKD